MGLSRVVVDPVVRRKAGFYRVDADRFQVRIAQTVEQYEQAFRLVRASYIAQGLEPLGADDLRVVDHHMLPETTVLVAYERGQAVGSMSLTCDSEAGLPLDRSYPEDLAALRRRGARLAEIGCFAVVDRCRGSGVAQLLSLAATRVAFEMGGASHIVVGVHPKATPFFRAVWGFEAFGPAMRHPSIDGAQQGLVVDLGHTRRHLRRHFPKAMPTGFRAEQHAFDGPPVPGLKLPETADPAGFGRWKMPRDVFQTLFRQRTDRLHQAEPAVRKRLRTTRTDRTLGRLRSGAA
jgi:GNAT superfamily N-acetyltransferase